VKSGKEGCCVPLYANALAPLVKGGRGKGGGTQLVKKGECGRDE